MIAGTVGRLGRSVGLRSGLWLSSSASLAQLVPLAVSPLLTRLYSPRQFGLYAAAGVTVLILATVAAGRYEMAIVLAPSRSEAVVLTALSLRIVVAVSVLLTALSAALLWAGPRLPLITDLGPWVLAVPLIILGTGVGNVLTQYALRVNDVSGVFAAELTKVVAVAATQLGLGLLGAGVAGLLIGTAVAAAVGNLRLATSYRRDRRAEAVSPVALRSAARRYSRFPRFEVVSSLLNSGSLGIATFGIAAVFSPAVVGWYSLASRVVTLPALTIGTAVGRVFYRQSAERVAAGRPSGTHLRRTALGLALCSAPLFGFLMVAGPQLFALVFGEQWREAGLYVVAMAPLMWIRLVVSPVSSSLLIAGWHRANLAWHWVLVLATALCVVVAAYLELTPMAYLQLSTAALGVVYVGLFCLAYAATRRPRPSTRPSSAPPSSAPSRSTPSSTDRTTVARMPGSRAPDKRPTTMYGEHHGSDRLP